MMLSIILASVAIVTIRSVNAQNLGDLPSCAVSSISILSRLRAVRARGTYTAARPPPSKLLHQPASSKQAAPSQTFSASAKPVPSYALSCSNNVTRLTKEVNSVLTPQSQTERAVLEI